MALLKELRDTKEIGEVWRHPLIILLAAAEAWTPLSRAPCLPATPPSPLSPPISPTPPMTLMSTTSPTPIWC